MSNKKKEMMSQVLSIRLNPSLKAAFDSLWENTDERNRWLLRAIRRKVLRAK